MLVGCRWCGLLQLDQNLAIGVVADVLRVVSRRHAQVVQHDIIAIQVEPNRAPGFEVEGSERVSLGIQRLESRTLEHLKEVRKIVRVNARELSGGEKHLRHDDPIVLVKLVSYL